MPCRVERYRAGRDARRRRAEDDVEEPLPPVQEEVVHAPEAAHHDARGGLKTLCRTWSTAGRRGGEVTHATSTTSPRRS
jgi:hypothetical protein